MKLRPYQKTDIQAIENAWKDYRSVLYQLPTGGGKSIILSSLINDYKDEKILIFAHKRRLLLQLRQHIINLGLKCGLLIAQHQEDLDANIIIVSIRTAVKERRLEMLVNRHWDKVIIDEARNSRTGSYDIVLDQLLSVHPQHKLLGVDATPYRKDKKRLDKHFQHLIVSSENIKSLQAKGFLAKERTYATPIGEIKEQVKEVANDYQQSQLSQYMRQGKYLDYVVDAYTKFGEGRQAIVFAVDKAHSNDLLNAFKAKGYDSVERIDSSFSESEVDRIYKDYEDKKIQILINIEMLTEGVDLPETGCIVGARPTKSLALYLQMAGRGTRPKNDGSDLIIIDCAGWTEEFGCISTPREWSLDPEVDPNNPRKKNRVVGKDKEGNLTTDIKQMDEFTELIEMTPEEYIGKVKGGLKQAEQQNLTIEEKIKKVEQELGELLHKAAVKGLKDKVSPFTCIVRRDEYDETVIKAYFFHKTRFAKRYARRSNIEIDAWTEGTHVVEMILSKREKMFASLDSREVESNWYRRDDKAKAESLREYREMAGVCGEVNTMIMDNKNLMMQILDKHQQIHDLHSSKINLEEYKDLQKKFEKEQWIKSIDDHLLKSCVFVLPNPLTMTNYFKGYDSRKIIEIELPKGNINKFMNEMKLKLKDRWGGKDEFSIEEKKYIKAEKIYELLEDSRWGKSE